MRKLSTKWPKLITLVEVAVIVFYLISSIQYKTYNNIKLLEKLWVAFFFTTITWAVYGIACLIAPKLGTQEPWKPGNDFNINNLKNDDSIVLCKGCRQPLGQAQIDYMLGNPQYQEWCREGFCSSPCFEKYKSEVKNK